MILDKGISVILISDTNYEKLIAEIYFNGCFVALLNQDAGLDALEIQFSSVSDKEEAILRHLPLSEFQIAIEIAKAKLKAG